MEMAKRHSYSLIKRTRAEDTGYRRQRQLVHAGCEGDARQPAYLGELGACLVHRVQPWRDELDGLDCLPHLPQPPLGILAEDLLVAEVRFHVDGGRVEQLPRLGISGQRIQTQEPMKERRSRARHANHKERLAHFHRLDGRLGGQQGFHPQAARQAATELIPDAQVAQRRDPLLLERPQDQAEVLLELQTPKVAGSRLAHRPLLHVVVVQLVLKRAQAQLPRRPGQRVEHLDRVPASQTPAMHDRCAKRQQSSVADAPERPKPRGAERSASAQSGFPKGGIAGSRPAGPHR
eukprot:scaffold266_cov248-Pinguiococcus_pyrenoidosus.AAC.26